MKFKELLDKMEGSQPIIRSTNGAQMLAAPGLVGFAVTRPGASNIGIYSEQELFLALNQFVAEGQMRTKTTPGNSSTAHFVTQFLPTLVGGF